MLSYSMIEYLVQHHVKEMLRERESDRLAAELACQEETGPRVWAGSVLVRLGVAIAGSRALLSANDH